MKGSFSTKDIALKVKRDGFASWKIHFMELVDEFRRTSNINLVEMEPGEDLNSKLKALLASIVNMLCFELKLAIPKWAEKRYFLDTPWFVSECESLKASAILESPLPFRANNIFVFKNFLTRV